MPSNREIFFKAVFVEPPQICGRKLLPYSLAQDYFLRNIGNPYVVGGQLNEEALLVAIFVCSLTYKQIRKYVYDPHWFRAGLWFLKWKFRKLSIASESFQAYFQEYNDIPEHFDHVPSDDEENMPVKADDRSEYGGPWQYHLVHILCREYGLSIDDAWDTGITTARCYYDIWAESTGMDDTIVPVSIGQPLLEKSE
jgi:hypothetical protein